MWRAGLSGPALFAFNLSPFRSDHHPMESLSPQDESGFTLVELIVVLLMIGVLLAIAVPTFLSAREKAQSMAAGSNLRSALSAVKTVYADRQTYESVAPGAPITRAVLVASNPSPGWGASGGAAPTTSSGPTQVSWQGSADVMLLAAKSNSGRCYYLRDDVSPSGGVSFGMDNASPCVATGFTGTWADSAAAAGW